MKTSIPIALKDRSLLEKALNDAYPDWVFDYSKVVDTYTLSDRLDRHTVEIGTGVIIVESLINTASRFFKIPWVVLLFIYMFIGKFYDGILTDRQVFMLFFGLLFVGFAVFYLNPYIKNGIKKNHSRIVEVIQQQ